MDVRAEKVIALLDWLPVIIPTRIRFGGSLAVTCALIARCMAMATAGAPLADVNEATHGLGLGVTV